MAERGYPVDLALVRAEGELLSEVPHAVRVENLNARRVLTSLPALMAYLLRERPVALLSVLHANIIAVLAVRLTGVPTRVVVSERNNLSTESQHYADDPRMRLMPRLVRAVYPRADAVVTVSHGVADDLVSAANIPPERVKTVYNPIITPELRTKARQPLAHPWFAPGQPPVVLAVGRLSPQKDFATLLDAFARLRQTQSARLLILGDGEERAALEAQIERLGLRQDVGLPGFVANPYPYMAQAGVFVLSSRWEGLPGVLIEALYCGPPLVATDCPSGPKEILANGRHGRLVPVANAAALANALQAALSEQIPRPAPESWYPFELETVVSEYLDVLIPKK
jgi:glycosyltransferase involved in cell wall biosynthesis